MKDLFKNSGVAWTVAFLCLAATGYLFVKNVKIPDVPTPQPGMPYITGNVTTGFPLGSIAKLKVELPKELPPGFIKASVIFKLLEVKLENGVPRLVEKTDFDTLADGSFIFGTGITEKELICEAFVTFVGKDTDIWVKNFILMERVKLGTAPQPPPPNPDPVNPVLPDGQFKLAQFTFDGVAKNVPANAARRDLAVASAANFRGVAAGIAAGVFKQPEDALKQIKIKNDDLTKNDPNKLQWAIFGDSLMNRLYEIDANRLFTDDVQQLRIALIEISDGLEAISKVK